MKISLSARLISIMVLSILLSSLITIFLVSTFTINNIRGFSHQRERDITLTMAEALSRSVDEDQLEKTIRSLGNQHNRMPRPMMGGRMDGMMEQMMSRRGGRRDNQMFPPLMMPSAGDAVISLLITDENGKIMQGPIRDHYGISHSYLSRDRLDKGAPFYSKGELAGYILTMNQAGLSEEAVELRYIQSIIKGVLVYPTFAALLASLLGALLLGRALKPLKSLYQGVLTIQKGEYSFRVDLPDKKAYLSSSDELTRLSEGFNDMASSLEASEEWKKQIISDTAHELRTPVSLIMGNLEMILEGVYEADRPRLESLYRESRVLADLIRNLQILASEESRQNRTEKLDYSLSELVKQCGDDFKPLVEKHSLTLQIESTEDLVIEGDRNKTRQVLKNLVVNAIRHTPRDGSITLRCCQDGDAVLLEVEDTGPGIPVELRDRVFDRFFKVDPSRNSEGSGLGLSISRLLIENQGGTISAGEGGAGGALFRISLPAGHGNSDQRG